MATVNNFLFFKRNFLNTEVTFTSDFGFTTVDQFSNLFDNNRDTLLKTSGASGDLLERWTFTFSESTTIDALHLDNINIKTGSFEFFDGFVWVSIVTINNTALDETLYFEFSSVSATQFRLVLTSSFDASEYFVGQLRMLLKLGSLECNPQDYTPLFIEAGTLNTTSTGQNVKVIFNERYGCKIDFEPAFDDDMDLLRSLKNLKEPFTVFPSGGIDQTEVGFRLRDIFTVNYTNPFNPKPRANLFAIGQNISVTLKEAG